jgi:hypothetical protein
MNPAGNKAWIRPGIRQETSRENAVDSCYIMAWISAKKHCKRATKLYETAMTMLRNSTKFTVKQQWEKLWNSDDSGTCTVMWTPQRTVFECCRDRKAGVYTPTIPCLPTSYGSRQINSLLRENLDKSHRLNKRVFIFTDSTVWTQKDSCLVFTPAVHRGYKCTEHVL